MVVLADQLAAWVEAIAVLRYGDAVRRSLRSRPEELHVTWTIIPIPLNVLLCSLHVKMQYTELLLSHHMYMHSTTYIHHPPPFQSLIHFAPVHTPLSILCPNTLAIPARLPALALSLSSFFGDVLVMTFPGRFSCHRFGSIPISVVVESNTRNRSSLADAQSAQTRSSRTVCNGCTRPSSHGCSMGFLVALMFLRRGSSDLLASYSANCATGNELRAPSMVSACDIASSSTSATCPARNGSPWFSVVVFAASVAVAQKLTGIVEDAEWPQPKNMNNR